MRVDTQPQEPGPARSSPVFAAPSTLTMIRRDRPSVANMGLSIDVRPRASLEHCQVELCDSSEIHQCDEDRIIIVQRQKT